MGRYYFDFVDGEEIYRDNEGTQFASAEAMRASAFKTLLEVMGSREPTNGTELMLLVRDAFELPALTAKLSLHVEYPAHAPVGG